MTVSEIIVKMVDFLNGSQSDINHFLKVHAYARVIGVCEGLSAKEQASLELAAVIHDIACPECRERFGAADGKQQEILGMPLALEFLKNTGLPDEITNRVIYLVGHHHTLEGISGMDYQILIEADYIVNAGESHYSKENILSTLESVFRTDTGKSLLRSVYCIE